VFLRSNSCTFDKGITGALLLLIVEDHLRCRFVHLDLRAHLLQAGSKCFNLRDSHSHYLKLCERTLSFAVPLREEGEVASLESPNGLDAHECRMKSFAVFCRLFLVEEMTAGAG
jgi:hypothetical protein